MHPYAYSRLLSPASDPFDPPLPLNHSHQCEQKLVSLPSVSSFWTAHLHLLSEPTQREQKLVVLDPKGRISAKAALYHNFFEDVDKQQFLQ